MLEQYSIRSYIFLFSFPWCDNNAIMECAKSVRFVLYVLSLYYNNVITPRDDKSRTPCRYGTTVRLCGYIFSVRGRCWRQIERAVYRAAAEVGNAHALSLEFGHNNNNDNTSWVYTRPIHFLVSTRIMLLQ